MNKQTISQTHHVEEVAAAKVHCFDALATAVGLEQRPKPVHTPRILQCDVM